MKEDYVHYYFPLFVHFSIDIYKTSSNDNIQEKDSKANTASCLSEQEKIISNLREENEELKKKLSAALGTIEKIKGLCEEI